MVSDMCIAGWFPYIEGVVFCFSAALAAFLVVALAVLTAPARRSTVAWAVFALGCIAAIYMAWETSALKEFIFAVLGGLFAVFLVIKRERRQAGIRETHPPRH